MPIKIPKPAGDRSKECVVILHKLIREVEIPSHNPSIQLLAKRMADYATAEEPRCMDDRIPLVGSDRYIIYKFPRWAHQIVEVVLRKGIILHNGLDDSLMDEVVAGEQAMKQLEALEQARFDILTPGKKGDTTIVSSST
jgi:hypothetical protein